jgi:hypothetical protein
MGEPVSVFPASVLDGGAVSSWAMTPGDVAKVTTILRMNARNLTL